MNVHAQIATPDTMTARHAILVYQAGGAAMLTIHPIEQGQIQPGRLLDRATWGDMLASVSSGPGHAAPVRRLIDPCLLFADPSRVLWHRPAQRRPIYFRTGRKEFDEAVSSKEVSHPPLLFLATPSNLYIYALESDQRPEADTPVCVAPYFNVYESGHMCRGNIRLPDRASPEDIPLWEDAFFQTNFTHSNRGRLTSHSGGHDGAWKAALSARYSWAKHLLPQKLTVQEVLGR